MNKLKILKKKINYALMSLLHSIIFKSNICNIPVWSICKAAIAQFGDLNPKKVSLIILGCYQGKKIKEKQPLKWNYPHPNIIMHKSIILLQLHRKQRCTLTFTKYSRNEKHRHKSFEDLHNKRLANQGNLYYTEEGAQEKNKIRVFKPGNEF